MWSSASLTASNPYARDSDAYIPNEKVNLQSSNESIADTERNVKVRGTTNSKIPSIFDHVICNSSIIESYYQLRVVAQGLTNEQVAERLVISPRTVDTHLTSIYSKIGVSSRSAATRYAIEHHLV